MGGERRGDGYLPLFETREATGRIAYRLYVICMFLGICMIWAYRATHIPRKGEEGRWVWIGVFAAEVWFGFYWIITQSVRWNRVDRSTFKERLSQRYEDELPGVDVFVCTADPSIEPPILVINTVLSVMAYNYPPEKLSVYLSDDGGSDLTFYALLEASRFTKHWIPFCKKFNVEPRCPAAYFSTMSGPPYIREAEEWWAMKKMYEEMENRIDTAGKLGRIPEEVRQKHKGFSEWNSGITSRDHQPILQILIDGRGDPNAVDNEGVTLPTLVYLAREKRPQHHHNFKAGAMNALIRVSSEMSNGSIILNVDCDMYANNSESVRDALCFFMDEKNGHEIAYVQFPQNYNNMTKNDLYGTSMKIISEVDFPGLDGYGGPLYVGTGCFHRRESLSGRKYNKQNKEKWESIPIGRKVDESSHDSEERIKGLATCTYEENTQWGNEMGLKYGCPVEDVITGLSIQCRGWKSVYFNPVRKGFLGLAPTSLAQSLVQHKRWSEGDFQILTSKYCPFIYGHGKIKLALQMGYGIYCFWAPNSFPTLFYVIFPSLCLYKGISLFPSIYSPWFLPFMYVIIAEYAYIILESLWHGMTLKGWWNEQRMWLLKRTTSYLFAFVDTLLLLSGIAKSAFIITAKVSDDDVSQRYEQEIMEFGSSSPMFTILASLAILNLFCLIGGATRVMMDGGISVLETLMLQFLLCGSLVLINVPLYQGLFFRKDKGRLPTSLAITSVVVAVLACLIPIY
ncbi:cellulose synthase-like protein E6 [Magnolia sinica]|uniref:cellulose synthase-like protein E6 n=1 Tax=Magnolia sinica TaxID=86752 RepID=UPI002659C904|nr:cellulose synthase-like protein E6 [Magnolia sinica]